MKVVAASCPHCGARLRVESTVLYVRCEYCGTTSRLQARTRMLERVVLPPGAVPAPLRRPPPPPLAPMPAAAPTPSPRWAPAIGAIVTIMVLGSAAGSAYMTSRRARDAAAAPDTTPRPIAVAAAAPDPLPGRGWIEDHGVLVVDVDGDAVLDVIGRNAEESRDAVRITALDGATGRPRWRSEVVANAGSYSTGRLVLAGDAVLLVDNHTLRAFEVATGATRWSAKLDERIASMCAGGDGAVLAVGADGAARSVRLSDGAVVGKERRPRSCGELPTDEQRRSYPRWDWSLARKAGLKGPDGYLAPGGTILGGARATGTPIATLAAFDARGKLRWKTAVSPEPLESDDRYPSNVVVGEREVCCTYSQGLASRTWHAACFALEDGRRIWDLEHGTPLRGLRILGRSLLASSYRTIMLLDLESGARRWQF